MKAFHHKALLEKIESHAAIYRYFPNYIDKEDVWGIFSIASDSWKTQIIKRADLDGTQVDTNHKKCILALTFKIRKAFKDAGEFPKSASWIA